MRLKELESVHNPHLRQVGRLLRSRRDRVDEGLFVVEGVRLCEEAIASDLKIISLFVTSQAESRVRVRRLLEQLEKQSRTEGQEPLLCRLTPQILAKVSDVEHSQGILAVVRLPSLLHEVTGRLILALDGVQDPGNVGTLLRTALAFGLESVLMGGNTADPYEAKALRAAMGATFHLSLSIQEPLSETLATLRQRDYQPVAGVPRGGIPIWDVDWRTPHILVLGNEGSGVSPEIINLCEQVTIPLSGAESLNVALAGAICLYEAARPAR